MGIFDFVTGYGGPLEGQSGGGLGGLFDPQDPRKAGLLSAAFGLLGQQGFGNAGLLGMQASQQARSRALQEKRQSLQDELVKNQLDQQRREAELSKLPGRFFRAPTAPVVDATGGMETAPENPNNSNVGAMDYRGLIQAYMGAGAPERAMQTLQLQSAMNPQPKIQELDPTKDYGVWDGTKFIPSVRGTPKANEPPSGVQEYQFAVGQGYKGTFADWKKENKPAGTTVNLGQPIAGVDAAGNPVFFQQPKGGGAPVIVPGVRPSLKADKDLTDAQAKANLFGTRAQEADKVIGDLATKGTVSPSIAQQMSNPSGITGRIATAMATPQQQQIDQAQRDFINAVLRRESGAVIADSEFANARLQYFPQPGDSPQVIAQKARNRKIATEGILAEVPPARRGVPTANTPAETFSDADKERRYQEWKARQK